MTLSVRNLLLSLASVAAITATSALSARAADPAGSASAGVVSHINILSDKSEDISTMEAWKKTYIKDGMTDQEKAIAIWKTVTRYRHQDNPPGEGLQDSNDKHPEGNVHEPFKTFHVYGYGMCCCAAADIEGLARYIGLPARGRIINNHSVPEIWYDDAWHLYDASLTFFLQKAGTDGKPGTGPVASVDEMKADIMAWRKQHPEIKNDSDMMNFAKNDGWKNGPPLFATANESPTGELLHFYSKDGWCRAEAPTANGTSNHGWNSNMSEYNYKHGDDKAKMITVAPDTKPAWNVYDYGAIMGYQLNVQLREGEKLTRCWYAKEVATGMNQKNVKRFDKFLAGDMSGLTLQQDLGDKNPGRIGNGVDEYNALADSKLAADAIACDNLTVTDGKIRIADPAKPATLIVRMPSNYVYLGGQMIANPALATGGSVKASISLNNGLDWSDLASFDKSGESKTTDLKDKIFNKYDYRVKFEFTGAGSGLDALKFVDSFQHSQAPLPVITAGENKITFSAGDAEGTVTVQGNMEIVPETKPDAAKPDAAKAEAQPDAKAKKVEGPAVLTMSDFHPILEGSANMKRFAIGNTGKGSAIIPVSTPGDISRVRLGVHWRARDAADGYTVSASFDSGATWKDVGKLAQANPALSTYLVLSDVPAGARNVQVKFDGTQKNTTCIFDLRVDVDYKEPTGGFRPVKVTYNWEEGDQVAVPVKQDAAAAAPTPAPAAPADDAKGGKGGKGGKGKKAPPVPTEMHGAAKSAEHVCTSPSDSWTLTCGPNTVAKSYTIELVK